MSATTQQTTYSRLTMNRMGIWLFFISESFLFSGLMVARMGLLRGHRPEVDQLLGLVITSILLLSSFFANRAEVAIAHNDRGNFMTSIFLTIVLGLIFVVGVGYEWSIAHDMPDENVYGAIFFFMTGMHAGHVISGIIFLIFVARNGMRGLYSAEDHWGVEACVLYWHFVDVVWVFFYVALYLIGTPPGA